MIIYFSYDIECIINVIKNFFYNINYIMKYYYDGPLYYVYRDESLMVNQILYIKAIVK